MHRKLVRIIGFQFVLFFCLVPSFTFLQAQTAGEESQPMCSCWCTGSEGAKSIGLKTATECREACKFENTSFLVCASDPSAWPINDLRCFTSSQCTKSLSDHGYDGVWDTQGNPNCPADYRYCFAKSGNEEIELGVPIGAIKSVKDLETYVSGGFQVLLIASTTLAIVLIMIGGIQYTLGSVSKEQMSKGKKRIQNAVIGLTLLLSSVLIVKTVNPQLLKLTLPQLPLIKTVLIGEGISCNDYITKKYELSEKTGECGDVSSVLKNESGDNVAEGTLCVWKTCDSWLERCLPAKTSQNGMACAECGDIVEGNSLGINASPALCAQFQIETQFFSDKPYYRRCEFTKDSGMNPGEKLPVERTGSCAFLEIDCSNVKTCDLYDSYVKARNSYKPNGEKLETILKDNVLGCGINGCGTFDLQTVCEENPCAVSKGGKISKTCEFDGLRDCE